MARKQYYANVRKKSVFTINTTHFAVRVVCRARNRVSERERESRQAQMNVHNKNMKIEMKMKPKTQE